MSINAKNLYEVSYFDTDAVEERHIWISVFSYDRTFYRAKVLSHNNNNDDKLLMLQRQLYF